MYAQAVVMYAFQSKRLHLLWQVLDILCTGVASHVSPSQHFVAAIQALDQPQPAKLRLLEDMADKVNGLPSIPVPQLPSMLKASLMHVLQQKSAGLDHLKAVCRCPDSHIPQLHAILPGVV